MNMTVIGENIFAIQACVDKGHTKEELEAKVNEIHLCGTRAGWMLRENGPDPVRVECKDDPNKEHVVFEC